MTSKEEKIIEEMRAAYALTAKLAGKTAADMVLGVMFFATSLKEDVSQDVLRKHYEKVMEIILSDFAEVPNE